jgi:hypothetical protein
MVLCRLCTHKEQQTKAAYSKPPALAPGRTCGGSVPADEIDSYLPRRAREIASMCARTPAAVTAPPAPPCTTSG